MKHIRDLTESDVRAILAAECQKAGMQQTWARQKKISAAHVNEVLHGRKAPASKILSALGMERVTLYRRVNGGGK